jgi:hypothetical protein
VLVQLFHRAAIGAQGIEHFRDLQPLGENAMEVVTVLPFHIGTSKTILALRLLQQLNQVVQ